MKKGGHKPQPFDIPKPSLTPGLRRHTNAVLRRLPLRDLETLDNFIAASTKGNWPAIGRYICFAILHKKYRRDFLKLTPSEQKDHKKFMERMAK